MKITAIRTFLMHVGALPADDAQRSAFRGTRNWLFVKVETDAGITGIGECSGWPRVIETAVQDLSRLLLGEDPTHIERLWQKMQIAIMGHGMTGTVGSGAMTGIDMALWDIKGKALGTPVWNLLGGKVRSGCMATPTHERPLCRSRNVDTRLLRSAAYRIQFEGLMNCVRLLAMRWT